MQDDTTDSITRTFSPTTETQYTINVEVYDGSDTTTDSITITVTPGDELTVAIIASESGSDLDFAAVDTGTTATFTAAVSGDNCGTLTYTWYLDGTEIDGETGDSVNIAISGTPGDNVRTVKVDVSDGETTVSQSIDCYARIDPEYRDAAVLSSGIDARDGYVDYSDPLSGLVLGDLDGDGDVDALFVSNWANAVGNTETYWFSGDGETPTCWPQRWTLLSITLPPIPVDPSPSASRSSGIRP